MDLNKASREELLAVITEQQTVIAEQQTIIRCLQGRVAQLEGRLTKGGPKGMPGLKPKRAKQAQPKKGRKRRPRGFGRVRCSAPTERVVHAVDHCPECNTRLLGGSVKHLHEVIDIALQPVRVTEHVFIERECPLCRERLVPKDALNGVVMGKQRLGTNLVSLMATLREEGRLPFRTIQWYLETFHQLALSVGAIVAAVQRVGEVGQSAAQAVLDRIRDSAVVSADETGWRQDGENGYAWTFSTASERYFVWRGRNKEVVDEVLGEEFDGVLVSDFYAAYNHYPGLHQRCWAHLLRDIHELKELYPQDVGLQRWAGEVHEVYKQAKDFSHPDERGRLQAQRDFESRLLGLCQPFLEDQTAAQRRLCNRISRFLQELFVFVAYPEVPADNNGAERSLRHLVTSRKISGGTRSPQGTTAKMTLATLFGTWRVQGLNPFLSCSQLLISPQV